MFHDLIGKKKIQKQITIRLQNFVTSFLSETHKGQIIMWKEVVLFMMEALGTGGN